LPSYPDPFARVYDLGWWHYHCRHLSFHQATGKAVQILCSSGCLTRWLAQLGFSPDHAATVVTAAFI
jgi:hypothetical protein